MSMWPPLSNFGWANEIPEKAADLEISTVEFGKMPVNLGNTKPVAFTPNLLSESEVRTNEYCPWTVPVEAPFIPETPWHSPEP